MANARTPYTDKKFLVAESIFDFDGTDDFINCFDNLGFNFTENDDFSISCVFSVNSGSYNGNRQLLVRREGGPGSTTGWLITFLTTPNEIRFLTEGTISNVSLSASIERNTLYHLLAQHDSTLNQIKLYINGVLIGIADTSSQGDFGAVGVDLYAGAYNDIGDLGIVQFFPGKIGAIKIFDNVLTIDEVRQLNKQPFIVPSTLHEHCVLEMDLNQTNYFEADADFVAKYPDFSVSDYVAFDTSEQYNYSKVSPITASHGRISGKSATEIDTGVDLIGPDFYDINNAVGVAIGTRFERSTNPYPWVRFAADSSHNIGTNDFILTWIMSNPTTYVNLKEVRAVAAFGTVRWIIIANDPTTLGFGGLAGQLGLWMQDTTGATKTFIAFTNETIFKTSAFKVIEIECVRSDPNEFFLSDFTIKVNGKVKSLFEYQNNNSAWNPIDPNAGIQFNIHNDGSSPDQQRQFDLVDNFFFKLEVAGVTKFSTGFSSNKFKFGDYISGVTGDLQNNSESYLIDSSRLIISNKAIRTNTSEGHGFSPNVNSMEGFTTNWTYSITVKPWQLISATRFLLVLQLNGTSEGYKVLINNTLLRFGWHDGTGTGDFGNGGFIDGPNRLIDQWATYHFIKRANTLIIKDQTARVLASGVIVGLSDLINITNHVSHVQTREYTARMGAISRELTDYEIIEMGRFKNPKNISEWQWYMNFNSNYNGLTQIEDLSGNSNHMALTSYNADEMDGEVNSEFYELPSLF